MQNHAASFNSPSNQLNPAFSNRLNMAIEVLLDTLSNYTDDTFDSRQMQVSEAEVEQLAISVIEAAVEDLNGRTLAGYLLQLRAAPDSAERLD